MARVNVYVDSKLQRLRAMTKVRELSPNMNVLLPSEVARLVLGYLGSTKCTGARAKFLEECPHLREYVYLLENGQEYPTTIFGRNLAHYLNIGYQYTQYISACGDPLKYPFASYFAAYTNRPTGVPFGEPSGQESPAQPSSSLRNGTPLTSPRTTSVPYRTPRGAGWPSASPAERDRRSPADSIIDVTTVTEPPSSESQFQPCAMVPAGVTGVQSSDRPVNEVSIQTEDLFSAATEQAMLEFMRKQQGQLSTLHARSDSITNTALRNVLLPRPCSTPLQDEQNLRRNELPVIGTGGTSTLSIGTVTPSKETTRVSALVTAVAEKVTDSESHRSQQTLVSSGEHKNAKGPFTTVVAAADGPPVDPTRAALLSPSGGLPAEQVELSTGSQLASSVVARCASPKRKTIAPKKRSLVAPSELSTGPPSPPKYVAGSTTRRMFDEFVETQLAEKLAESINEAALNVSANESLSAFAPGGSDGSNSRTANQNRSSRSVLAQDSNSASHSLVYQNEFLDLAISKALADPVVEELAQYMALKTTSGDLDTPTGTPIKEPTLHTPFKQIAEEASTEPIFIEDLRPTQEALPAPKALSNKLPSPASGTTERTSCAAEARSVVLQPGHYIQLSSGFISVTAGATLTARARTAAPAVASSCTSVLATGPTPSVVPLTVSAAFSGAPDPMKIVVNSSPVKACLQAPPVLRNAPRKPSPKISPSDSTTLITLEEATRSESDEGSRKASRSQMPQTETPPKVIASATIITAASTASAAASTASAAASTASASTASVRNGSAPAKKSTTSSHIRALDFDGLAECAARYPNLYRNVNIYESTSAPPLKTLPKTRLIRSRKRKPSNMVCKSPKALKRAAEKGSIEQTDTATGSERTDPGGVPVTLSVFNVPTAIVSIPDEVKEVPDGDSDGNKPLPEAGSTRNGSRQCNADSPGKPKRRQAIMVDVAPPQRRTAPVRVASSRARPLQAGRTAKDDSGAGHSATTANGPATASSSEFVLPTTPVKASASANSSSRAPLPLTSIKGRISIGKMQELQEAARRVAKAADTRRTSPSSRTGTPTAASVVRRTPELRAIAPKGVSRRASAGTQNQTGKSISVEVPTSRLPPIAPKPVAESDPSSRERPVSTTASRISSGIGVSLAPAPVAIPSQDPKHSQTVSLLVRPPAAAPPVATRAASENNIAPNGFDISTLLDLVHKSNTSTKPTPQSKT
ncbi:hypothetical protein BIW11_14172 [Tropilaelaps mercedesae]|uniref:Uncharacterized protein n=1 Tax=Tropilaelaps mercedesae TaxID=418985 RepID=A0A1V9WYV9_9ACAR|nr:hypothetical protein BIW11_14172 [Tropilaelaps mercedesae]